jgi:hypothetical protein
VSALDDYPRELSLVQRRGKWLLVIHGRDVTGEAEAAQRWVVEGIAEAYASMRRDMEAGNA